MLKKFISVCILTVMVICCFNIVSFAAYYDPETGEEMVDVVSDEAVTKQELTTDQLESAEKLGAFGHRKGRILVNPGIVGLPDPHSVGGDLVGHAGIQHNQNWTVEALQHGVDWSYDPIWISKGRTIYGLGVRSTGQSTDELVADHCSGRVGSPYLYNFFKIQWRNTFYCSHLVWATYLDVAGVNLLNSFKTADAIVSPNDLINSWGTITEFIV